MFVTCSLPNYPKSKGQHEERVSDLDITGLIPVSLLFSLNLWV